MRQQAIDDAIAHIQQILDRDYAHLEWRVLATHPGSNEPEDEPFVYVHSRTRDFRFRCRVARPWSIVLSIPTLRLLVADVAAEAEQTLAEQAAAAPKWLRSPYLLAARSTSKH